MDTIRERLIELCNKKNIKVTVFERTVGLVRGHMYTIKTLRSDTLEKIKEAYPDVNLNWLVYGNGDMLERIIDRLYRYLEYKGIEIENANEILGWSKTLDLKKMKFVTTLQDVKTDAKRDLTWERSIKRILKKFPDINEEWLKTGEGNMLITGEIMPTVQNANFLARISGSDLLPKYKDGDIVVCQIVGTAQIEKTTKTKSTAQTKKTKRKE